MAESAGSEISGVDRLIEILYAAAFERSATAFRPYVLEQICLWSGASNAVWLTRSVTEWTGEYATWPPASGISADAANALSFPAGQRMLESSPPGGWFSDDVPRRLLGFKLAHRGAPMRSVVALIFAEGKEPDHAALQRVIGHMIQAGTLALSHFIHRDEWLRSMGRPSRGAAALIDERGGIYVTCQRFPELIRSTLGNDDPQRLPFPLPEEILAAGEGEFTVDTLRFRLQREGRLFTLYARRPHPLDALSPREQQVARALASGKTFKSIAREYAIAISTVANHASRIYRKLGLFRREELVGLLRKAADES